MILRALSGTLERPERTKYIRLDREQTADPIRGGHAMKLRLRPFAARVALFCVPMVFLTGCNGGKRGDSSSSAPVASAPSASATTPSTFVSVTQPKDDGTIPSGTGIEKSKPSAGKGNVQGKVMFNGK